MTSTKMMRAAAASAAGAATYGGAVTDGNKTEAQEDEGEEDLMEFEQVGLKFLCTCYSIVHINDIIKFFTSQ